MEVVKRDEQGKQETCRNQLKVAKPRVT